MRKPLNVLLVLGSAAALVMISGPLAARAAADGSVKVSLRSVGVTDVQRVAVAHGGGGHRFAAGFTSDVSIEETVERIRAAL